jgi:hypothetical protein
MARLSFVVCAVVGLACGPGSGGSGGDAGVGAGVDAGGGAMPGDPGVVALRFHHLLGGAPLDLAQGGVLEDGSALRFTKVRYWFSNVVLLGDQGSDYSVPDSYFLMEQTADRVRLELDLAAVPAGRYRGLRFSMGVDEAHNHSLDALVGELDVNANMSWNWNSGFIFFKAEGTVEQEPQFNEVSFSFHIGNDLNYQSVELVLEEGFEVGAATPVALNLNAELTQVFRGLDRGGNLSILGGSWAGKIAENYSGMWSLEVAP